MGFFEFSYRYDVDKSLAYYSRISAADYYFFDHRNRISNYYGVYELSLGLVLGKYDEATKQKFLTFTIDLTERFYLLDLANDEPYRFANGQGLFGVDSRTWFKETPSRVLHQRTRLLGEGRGSDQPPLLRVPEDRVRADGRQG